MALSVHLLHPLILPQPIKFHSHPFPSTPHLITTSKTQISCSRKSTGNSDRAFDAPTKLEKKLAALLAERAEAMEKSQKLLFTELCNYLGLRAEEMKNKWKQAEEEDKLVLVNGFVSEWASNFHPLSAKSVKELVDEYLVEADDPPPVSSPQSSALFPGLKKIMGF